MTSCSKLYGYTVLGKKGRGRLGRPGGQEERRPLRHGAAPCLPCTTHGIHGRACISIACRRGPNLWSSLQDDPRSPVRRANCPRHQREKEARPGQLRTVFRSPTGLQTGGLGRVTRAREMMSLWNLGEMMHLLCLVTGWPGSLVLQKRALVQRRQGHGCSSGGVATSTITSRWAS